MAIDDERVPRGDWRDTVTARTVKLTYLPMAADTDSELSESFPISRNT